MDNTSYNQTVQSLDYQQLIRDLQSLQEHKKKLETVLEFLSKSFSDLDHFLHNWELRNDLYTVVEDINGILGSPEAPDNVMQLQEGLNSLKQEVEMLENSLREFEQVYAELRQKPDRHGKAEASQKAEEFLASLQQLHIEQIRHTVDETIPRLKRDMQAVLKAFETENSKQAMNMSLAAQLLERIKEYLGYADKFNSVNICRSCEPKVINVMQNPSIDPDKDTEILQNVQKELDALRAAFDNEKQQFLEFERNLSEHLDRIWAEDYEYFTQIFEEDSCKVRNTLSELRSTYEQFSDKKNSDINNVELQYDKRRFPRTKIIMQRFSDDFYQIRNNFSSKSDLNNLVTNINEFIKERRREIARKTWEITKKVFKIITFPIVIIGMIIAGIIKIFSKD